MDTHVQTYTQPRVCDCWVSKQEQGDGAAKQKNNLSQVIEKDYEICTFWNKNINAKGKKSTIQHASSLTSETMWQPQIRKS